MARSINAFVLLIALTMPSFTAAADKGQSATTVSLTSSVHAGAGTAAQELMASLLALLEVDIASRSQFSVVERRQIDLALLEVSLSEGFATNSEARLQMGKLASADLIVTLELLIPDNEGKTNSGNGSAAYGDRPQRALIRIVESLTGVVRGVSVVSIEASRLDEAAGQIADYLTLIEAQPERPPVTVAIAPFESLGRFDRLRPLELGLRDMVATRLRRWSDRLASADNATETAPNDRTDANGDAAPRGFRVLQRSNMQELLREFELIQSALVDRSRLPKTLPSRAAAFLVQGTVDEKNDDGEFRIVVNGELIHAASNRAVHDFEFDSAPEELEIALAHQVDLIAGRLTSSTDEVSRTPGVLREVNEVDALLNGVASDLRRFHRKRPIDFSIRRFELPGAPPASGQNIVDASSPLGRAVLTKSIDRLEATLFLSPERRDAAYALAFCCSFSVSDIGNPDRADELLRRAAAAEDVRLRVAALRLLAEVNFHHKSGRVLPGREKQAVSALTDAFQNMPEEHRDVIWARLPAALSPLLARLDDSQRTMQVIELAAAEAENPDAKFTYQLAMGVRALANGLLARRSAANNNDAMSDPIPLFERWVKGDQLTLKQVAARGLAFNAERQRDFAAAAKWYRTGADVLSESDSRVDAYASENMRVHAGRCLRQAGQVDDARQLLESFSPADDTSLNAGYHAVELGQCYRDLNEPEKAIDVLVSAAEHVPSLRYNSPVERLIRQLGGVPLSDDRKIDVEYIDGPAGRPLMCRALATNGSTLFCAGGFRDGVAQGVLAFEPHTKRWQSLTSKFGRVTAMTIFDGELWIATASDGVWRGSLTGNDWKQWSTSGGLPQTGRLPDNRAMSLAVSGRGAFAGLGTGASGGVVLIEADGSVTVLDGADAPTIAPSHLVVHGGFLLAATRSTIHELDLETGEWRSIEEPTGPGSVAIFPGNSHAWTSAYRREIVPFNSDKSTADRFRTAWFSDKGKAGYLVRFVVEHEGRVWFGGGPWAPFRSAGFYSIEPTGGDFRIYGLRDGFRMSSAYSTYAGVAIDNDLWIATSAGLARVTPR